MYRHLGSVQAVRPIGGSRGIALLFFDHSTRRGEGSASRPGRSLPPGKTGIHCTGGWVGPRAGLDRCGKSRPPQTGIRSPDRPARSQSLYRLSYPAHSYVERHIQNTLWAFFFISFMNLGRVTVEAAQVWRSVDISQVRLSPCLFAPPVDQSECCIRCIPTPHTSPTSAAETGYTALLGGSRLHRNYSVLYSLLSLSSSRWNMTWFVREQAFYRNGSQNTKDIWLEC